MMDDLLKHPETVTHEGRVRGQRVADGKADSTSSNLEVSGMKPDTILQHAMELRIVRHLECQLLRCTSISRDCSLPATQDAG